MLASLERLDYGATTFLITHDLRHAARADAILFLEAGRVVERGTHAELLIANGPYAALHRAQAGAHKAPAAVPSLAAMTT